MIEVNNLTVNQIDRQFLKKVAQNVLDAERLKSKVELSIALVGETRMRALNKKYRGKDRVTDVLSFGEPKNQKNKTPKNETFVGPPDNVVRLGEVIICPGEAKKNAAKIGHSVKKEIAILIIHGVLHLLGYDHEKEYGRDKMARRQEEILSSLKID